MCDGDRVRGGRVEKGNALIREVLQLEERRDQRIGMFIIVSFIKEQADIAVVAGSGRKGCYPGGAGCVAGIPVNGGEARKEIEFIGKLCSEQDQAYY